MAEPTIPKQELLRKLLKMTTATNDGECLTAIRKANDLLKSAGWDWDKLIDAKIKIVDNPFAGLGDPRKPCEFEAPRPAPRKPAPQQAQTPRPTSSPGPGMMWWFDTAIWDWVRTNDPNYRPPTAKKPKSSTFFTGLGLSRSNMYANHCYCCGDYVPNNAGFILQPKDFNPNAQARSKSGWDCVCKPCEATRTPDIYGVPSRAAPKNTGQTTVNAPAPDLGKL